MSRCVSPEQLQALLDDRLSAVEAGPVEAHLEGCPGCQQALERLSAASGQGHHPWRPPDGACLRRLREGPPATPLAPPLPTVPLPGPALVPAAPLRTDEQALLRKRLLLVAGLFAAEFPFFAAMCAALTSDPLTLSLDALMVLLSAGVIVLLLRRRELTMTLLRRVEVTLFVATVLVLTRIQWLGYRAGPASVAAGDWYGLLFYTAALDYSWAIFVIGYGLLIPNTFRRAAFVVGLVVWWPVLMNAVWCLPGGTPAARAVVAGQSAVNLSCAAVLALFGAHRIETLRQQVAGARRLGPYRLTSRLGAGGMGEVWLAEHVLLKRPCAVKLIRPERAGDPQSLRRFEREVRATAALSHPNTVEVYDYGTADDGAFYYAMEYLPGLSLEELVTRHGPLEPGRAVHLLLQVAGALQEAHAAGLVHRDIKPSNVLVCRRGGLCDVAKLLDFGLVRAPLLGAEGEALTQEGTIAGTPAYMSPEQAGGQAGLDARSDIYSLGALAYFLLTGRPPFVRPTAVQTLAAHLSEPVVPPASVRPEVPADLEAAVLGCLEKDPGRRFQSAGELGQALAGCACAGGWTAQRADDWWRGHAGEWNPGG